MKEGLIPIGKMAAMNRVSVPTLRLYDEKELLKPRYIDPETGYRYYDINQNARLEMIAYMKELGMTPWNGRSYPSSGTGNPRLQVPSP